LWLKQTGTVYSFLLQESFDTEPHNKYGSPQTLWTEYIFDSIDSNKFAVILQWFNKTSTRLPEASWLAFKPVPQRESSWNLDKLGELVSPLDVVLNGSQHLHVVQSGVYLLNHQKKIFSVESIDAALVSTGGPNPFPIPLSATPVNGAEYNLNNNIWGTNYPMWYPFDDSESASKFRFVISFY